MGRHINHSRGNLPRSRGDECSLTDSPGVANIGHVYGDAVVVHARRHRVDAREFTAAAITVTIVTVVPRARAGAAAADKYGGKRKKIVLPQFRWTPSC